MVRLLLPSLLALALGCSQGAPPIEDAGPDAAVATDLAAPVDLPAIDLVAPADAAVDPFLGTLSGACGAVKALLHDPAPSLVENAVVFLPAEMYVRAALSPGGQRIFDTPNAGGSSTESEVMSFEVLASCDGATLQKTETEILYAPPDDGGANSITDLLVSIGGERVGVSVTRAYKPSGQGPLSDGEVRALLEKKLAGVNRSSMRVLAGDRWVKQILHVFVADPQAVKALERVVPLIDAKLRADTIVLATATRGGGFIYCNPDPPLGSECPP
ncbi:MAG: hypothetical protein EXR72_00240 [Myxococcales bacterium]|nr:hypothetical protein [Myxococcales bacterium]